MSVFPVYNKICSVDSRSEFSSKRFEGLMVYIDPDLPIYFDNWIKHLANIVRDFYHLDNLWNLNGGQFNISYSDWINLNIYERRAFEMTASDKIEESNKSARQQKADMEQKMEQAKEYKSQFSGITMPRFVN